nr:hypothetical protein [Tanacetum cinerariifolium]
MLCEPLLVKAPEGGAVSPPRNKRDEEFTEEDNRNELADIKAINILSQGLPRLIFNILNQNEIGREIWVNLELLMKGSGQTLERRKEALFDEFERFRANGNELIQDYFVHFHNDSHNDAMLATMNQIANLLCGLQKQFPPTNNQLRTSSNPKTHATVHDGEIVTEIVQRRALSNTGTKGIQTTGSGVNNSRKKLICYNYRVEGHVARQCKEPKRARDSQWYHDKALLMQDKEKGVVLDAESKAFLADVECTTPYDQPLALTTTNLFEANHEDAYDSDVDEGPHASAAFLANLSSTSGTNGLSSSHINKVQISDDSFSSDVSYSLAQEMQQEEHLNSEVDSVLDEIMITYDEYQNYSGVEAVPTVVSADEADKQSMIAILQRMHTEIVGYVRVNDEHKLVNATLTSELEWCKIEMQALELNKVKHDLDMTIVKWNKRNAELEEENVILKSTFKSKVMSIKNLQQESKQVLSEKKILEDKYLEEIVVLTNANKVPTNVLKGFQMPTHTILMLSKRPNFASHDLHKTGLGYSNPRYGKQPRIAQPALYDGHALVNPNHPPTRVHDSKQSLVHAEVYKIKMAERPGHALHINYAKLNALYDQFVPQKELSREQVYWLPAIEIASQSSTLAKPVAPFVHTRPVKSDVHKKCKLLAVGSPFFWQWEPPPLAVGTYTASGNSLLACQLDEQWFDLTKDTLRDTLQITPVNDNNGFSSPPTPDALINFVNDLRYPKAVRNLSDVVTNDMFQPWRALTTIINLCLTGKTLGFKRPKAPVLQILWGVVNRAYIDYAERI